LFSGLLTKNILTTSLGITLPTTMNTKVVVGGGGLMGFGIATTLIISKYLVTLKEVNKKFLTAGIERTKGEATW